MILRFKIHNCPKRAVDRHIHKNQRRRKACNKLRYRLCNLGRRGRIHILDPLEITSVRRHKRNKEHRRRNHFYCRCCCIVVQERRQAIRKNKQHKAARYSYYSQKHQRGFKNAFCVRFVTPRHAFRNHFGNRNRESRRRYDKRIYLIRDIKKTHSFLAYKAV